jgi:hypothetical protein
VIAVGVSPPAALAARPRLFAALAAAGEARFVACEAGGGEGLDALVRFSPPAGVAAPAGLPRLDLVEGIGSAARGPVRLHDHPLVPPLLRGAAIADAEAAAPLAGPVEGATLASRDGAVLWAAGRSALAPSELRPGERLRDRLREGRFLALLPMLELLRAAAGPLAWTLPRPRAAMIIDDPNLRRPSYGFLSYPQLVPHARAHGYHLGVALIPLDARRAHPAARRLFAEAPDALSLVVHGNDHLRGELARPRSEVEAEALLVQALVRVRTFERRTGLRVSRVMVPPHEVWGAPLARAIPRTEVEALCADPAEGWLDDLACGGPLAGWGPTALAEGGLPVLLRSPLEAPAGDLRLRAYLGQPLLLYLHHADLREGLAPLAEAAARVREANGVAWGPLESVSRGASAVRVVDGVLEVRMAARRALVDVPEGAAAVRALLPPEAPADQETVRAVGTAAAPGEAIACAGPGPVELRLERAGAPARAAPQRPAPWAVARRALTEARDRAMPALARARHSSAGRRSSP